jgi:outer membrane protein assembly factor BamB
MNRTYLASLGIVVCLASTVGAADWPLWRYDAQRSAAAPQKLAARLHMQWVRQFPRLAPAWPDQDKMQFDIAYEPVVMGKRLFINSPQHDCVTALDTATGKQLWRFFTDGPVRFAPAAWQDRVYFTSDDGHLYCVDAADGSLRWKFRGGPSDRKILGNERLISTWPARGAPVIVPRTDDVSRRVGQSNADAATQVHPATHVAGSEEATVYFAASIWPFMGVFIHALDARTGAVVWTNDGDGSIYMKQPHNADSFAGVAPQGPLVAQGNRLLIPGGRSLPALYDRDTGKFLKYQLAENGKRGGGWDVAVMGDVFFNGGAVFDLATQKHLAELSKHVVLTPDIVYAHVSGSCRAYDLRSVTIDEVERKEKDKTVKVKRWSMKEIAACKMPEIETLIKAGDRLYVGAAGRVQAVDISLDDKELSPGWSAEVEGTVVRLIAADDRLFAVTREGNIYCFGAAQTDSPFSARSNQRALNGSSQKHANDGASAILAASGQRQGYAVAWGADTADLVRAIVRQSTLHIVIVEPDAAKVRKLREELTAEDLYGTRIAVVPGDPATVSLPPYFVSLMIGDARGLKMDRAIVGRLYESLRPFGGVACFLGPTNQLNPFVKNLANASLSTAGDLTLLKRVGPLPGSANWTHEHADAANTRVSKDQIVKAPLGLLWFGGPSHDSILPRHGHGPQPQVIDGRLIIEGVDSIRAIDIYTGRLLWETSIPGVGRFFNNTAHQPGANASGSNFVSASDGIYVVHETKCLRLDPETGKITREFQLPRLDGMKAPPRWGYLNVAGDYLIGGADPLFDPTLLPKPPRDPKNDKDAPRTSTSLTKVLQLLRGTNDNLSASRHLVVMNRHTGHVLWIRSAYYAFRHNAICVGGGRLYAVDRLSGRELQKYKTNDKEPPHPPRLLTVDLATGRSVWSTDADIFGTWLSYSAKHDVVVEAGRVARDTLSDEPKGMRAYEAKTGRVLWFEKGHLGPAMIHGDEILQGQGACDLLTGAVKMRTDPITGEAVPWTWTRTYGCNTPAASEHLLTFRSGAAGFFDLCNDGGTGNIGGFRSSCTNNLVVAGGVITVPDYTRTCICLYQNQTSVGLIHLPDAEMWTYTASKDLKGTVRRLGLNLGAPGDRKADDGTLWLEYPFTGGISPKVNVSTTPSKPATFRRHASLIDGPLPWVAASGIEGAEEIAIDLGEAEAARKFTVRLVFAEAERLQPGQRVFDVAIQGREVLGDFDIVKEAGAPLRTVVKEFDGIVANDRLTIRLTPAVERSLPPVISGIEIIAR